jgi:AraC-like DNA-binding protein
MVKTYVHIITICAKYLTISNALVREKLTVGQHIVKYIGENYSSHIQIKDICRELGYSKSTILSAFKQEFGTTINAYLTNYRLGVAKRQLEENELTINEIALGTGFADQSYFSKVFSAKYGTTPSEYRRLSVK